MLHRTDLRQERRDVQLFNMLPDDTGNVIRRQHLVERQRVHLDLFAFRTPQADGSRGSVHDYDLAPNPSPGEGK